MTRAILTTARTILMTLGVGLALAAPAEASRLYGVDFGAPGNFYEIDTGTGAASYVGDPGNNNIGDLTSDTRTANGPVWGIDLDANALLTFDVLTGGIVNTLGITGTSAPITSIAFDPVTGVLFGNDTASFGGSNGALYTIDVGTGAATSVGATGVGDIFALSFDQSGNLYGIDDSSDEFLAIDTGTGTVTSIGSTGLGSSFDIASDPLTDFMYLVDSGRRSLFTIDTGTAATTLVGGWGSEGSNIAGLAFVAPVPIPGALPLLVTGLGVLAWMRRRRPVGTA